MTVRANMCRSGNHQEKPQQRFAEWYSVCSKDVCNSEHYGTQAHARYKTLLQKGVRVHSGRRMPGAETLQRASASTAAASGRAGSQNGSRTVQWVFCRVLYRHYWGSMGAPFLAPLVSYWGLGSEPEGECACYHGLRMTSREV